MLIQLRINHVERDYGDLLPWADQLFPESIARDVMLDRNELCDYIVDCAHGLTPKYVPCSRTLDYFSGMSKRRVSPDSIVELHGVLLSILLDTFNATRRLSPTWYCERYMPTNVTFGREGFNEIDFYLSPLVLKVVRVDKEGMDLAADEIISAIKDQYLRRVIPTRRQAARRRSSRRDNR